MWAPQSCENMYIYKFFCAAAQPLVTPLRIEGEGGALPLPLKLVKV